MKLLAIFILLFVPQVFAAGGKAVPIPQAGGGVHFITRPDHAQITMYGRRGSSGDMTFQPSVTVWHSAGGQVVTGYMVPTTNLTGGPVILLTVPYGSNLSSLWYGGGSSRYSPPQWVPPPVYSPLPIPYYTPSAPFAPQAPVSLDTTEGKILKLCVTRNGETSCR